MNYLPRIVDSQLREALASAGFVVIEGVRGCGKTSTAKQFAKSVIQLDRSAQARALAIADPVLALAGEQPRLVDEWQIAPHLWDEARHTVDEQQLKGAYIFTGSAFPTADSAFHPGQGRVRRLRMRPFTLQESGVSNGVVSLGALLSSGSIESTKTPLLALTTVLELIARGGWPASQGIPVASSLRNHMSYLHDLVRYDFQTFDGPSDPSIAKLVLRSLARNVGQKTPIATIAKDIPGPNSLPLRHPTAQAYVSKFQQLMVVEEVPAWVPHLRSRYTVARSPIRYFVDPSLAVGALSGTPAKLLKDIKSAGFLFENLVIRDLLVFADAAGATVSHYRDESGLEVDAIIEGFDGTWGAIEIKLGFLSTDEAARNLLNFRDRVDTSVVGEPRFLAVVTNSEYSYTRPDGVHVISITALGA